MLIIPVENKPDWRRPPVITLVLILVNAWIYFGTLGSDEAAYADAHQAYLAGGLLEREAELFRAYARSAYGEDLPDTTEALVGAVIFDLGFDAHVAPHLSGDPAWQTAREHFEARRDRISWIRYGLRPVEADWWHYLTSMFLHGGVDHLVGNMVFLFLFGFALERALGTVNYGAVYFVGGLAGGAVHVLVNAGSHVPTIGASGAVSALMGAYLAVYQLRRIRFFYSVLVYFGEFRAPALVVLPLWLLKEIYGYLFGDESIAYWDHIGGLIMGAAIGALVMRLSKGVDQAYLNAGGLEDASRKQIARLDALIDQFKYDQAKALAASHLAEHPTDTATWRKYLELLAADEHSPDYHRAIKRLLGLSAARPDGELAQLIQWAYERYVAGQHPKPALKDPVLLCAVGELLARSRKLDDARRIANSLLKANRREAEVAALLRALVRGLTEAGAGSLARHYRNELNVRFGDSA